MTVLLPLCCIQFGLLLIAVSVMLAWRKTVKRAERFSEEKMKNAEDWMMIALHHANKVREFKNSNQGQIAKELQDYQIAFRTFADLVWPDHAEGKTFGDFRTWIFRVLNLTNPMDNITAQSEPKAK